jgi:hypothetical protein
MPTLCVVPFLRLVPVLRLVPRLVFHVVLQDAIMKLVNPKASLGKGSYCDPDCSRPCPDCSVLSWYARQHACRVHQCRCVVLPLVGRLGYVGLFIEPV